LVRTVVSIHEYLCDRRGGCVTACAEGAVQIVQDRARLVSDSVCDGPAACLGRWPQRAISIERRKAAPFDQAVARRRVAASGPTARRAPEPKHWPVELQLLPVTAPVLRGACLLVSADCVPLLHLYSRHRARGPAARREPSARGGSLDQHSRQVDCAATGSHRMFRAAGLPGDERAIGSARMKKLSVPGSSNGAATEERSIP
jgi:Pyruvate/2-oxoacid:ferredoxin oxidoreductase delta subunit